MHYDTLKEKYCIMKHKEDLESSIKDLSDDSIPALSIMYAIIARDDDHLIDEGKIEFLTMDKTDALTVLENINSSVNSKRTKHAYELYTFSHTSNSSRDLKYEYTAYRETADSDWTIECVGIHWPNDRHKELITMYIYDEFERPVKLGMICNLIARDMTDAKAKIKAIEELKQSI